MCLRFQDRREESFFWPLQRTDVEMAMGRDAMSGMSGISMGV